MRGLVQLFGIKYFFSLQPVLAQKRALVCTYLLRRTILLIIKELEILGAQVFVKKQFFWETYTSCSSTSRWPDSISRGATRYVRRSLALFLCKSIVQLSKWTFCSPRVLSYFIILMCGPTNVRRGREALHIKMLPPFAALDVHPLSVVDTGFQGGRRPIYRSPLSKVEGARLQNLVWGLTFFITIWRVAV